MYNKPGYELINNTTWCMIGDAVCKGVALEAIQLAGHWKLNNIVVIYDNNQITCDGSVDLCNTEDVNARCAPVAGRSSRSKTDATTSMASSKPSPQAKASTEKPTFINVRTVIGVGSSVAGDAKALVLRTVMRT